jgi:hypothetical protein
MLDLRVARTDRLYAARGVPVAERDLQCGGVCQEADVEAWMHLRLRAGRREACAGRQDVARAPDGRRGVDDLVRRTAAGTIVPVQFRVGGTTHRFWATDTDRDRLEDLRSDDTELPPVREPDAPTRASRNRPTCKPALSATNVSAPGPELPAAWVPAQPAPPATETAPAQSPAVAQPDAHPALPKRSPP